MAEANSDTTTLSHYDVAYRWQRGDKTGWAPLGRAFPNADGSITVKLDAMPVPGIAADPGEYRLYPKSVAQKKADKAVVAAVKRGAQE